VEAPLIQLEEAASPADGQTLVFAGDVFARSRERLRSALDPAFASVIASADVSVANLEAPLVERPEPAPKVGPHLHMAPSVAADLRAVGFDGVTLANNHMGDHGPTGVAATIAACESAGLQHTGAAATADAALQPLRAELPDGTRVALIAVAEAEFGIADDTSAGVASISDVRTLRAVEAARRTHDLVVVAAHGGVEELPLPPFQRRRQLRALIEAGTDLVIGHHPHVPQGWESFVGGAIFFSLGDLFVDHAGDAPGHSWGYLVRARVRDGRLERLGVIPYEREGDNVVALAGLSSFATRAAYLADAARIAGGDELEAVWQELAVRAYESRYLGFFARLGLAPPRAPRGPRGTRTLKAIAAAVRDALPGVNGRAARAFLPTPTEALTLANLVRCESHRWTIETAMAVLGGERDDLRSLETARTADRLAALGSR
jgi:hypothetical protein